MTYIPDDEYRRIRTSWDTAPRGEPQWSHQRMANACHENILAAAKNEASLRHAHDSLRPGDVRLVGTKDTPPLRLQITTAQLDQVHWRAQLAYWRGQCAEHGPDAMPSLRFDVRRQGQARVPAAEAARSQTTRQHWSEATPVRPGDPIWDAEQRERAAARLIDRRLPREPGDDDLPF